MDLPRIQRGTVRRPDSTTLPNGNPEIDPLLLGEKTRLGRSVLRVAKVDETNADEAKTLPWVQTNILPQ